MAKVALPEEQEKFWVDLSNFIRWSLTLPEDTHEVDSFYDFWGATPEAKRNLSLARAKLIPIKKDGKVKHKHVDKLRPSDVPFILAFWEDTFASNTAEYLSDDELADTPGTLLFMEFLQRWRALKPKWRAR